MSKTVKTRQLKNVELKNGKFLARNVDASDYAELDRIYEFRHHVFSRELGWVSSTNRERDEYDRYSVHFGAFSDSDEIVGYSRLILPEGTFMLEREFTELVEPGYELRKGDDTVEASRFAVSRTLRRTREGFAVSELLCKTMCLWARRNSVRYCYLVLDNNYLAFLQQFLSIQAIGPTKAYEPGLTSVAVIFDLAELRPSDAENLWATLGAAPNPNH